MKHLHLNENEVAVLLNALQRYMVARTMEHPHEDDALAAAAEALWNKARKG